MKEEEGGESRGNGIGGEDDRRKEKRRSKRRIFRDSLLWGKKKDKIVWSEWGELQNDQIMREEKKGRSTKGAQNRIGQ